MQPNFLRIHHKDRLLEGVYRTCQGIYRDEFVSTNNPRSHPHPMYDSLLIENSGKSNHYLSSNKFDVREQYFGFKSYDQMRSWFFADAHLEIMQQKNMVVGVFSFPLDKIVYGYTQAMVDKHFFESLDYRNLDQYLINLIEIPFIKTEELYLSQLT